MDARVSWGELTVGRSFAERYRFERVLGRGGMGMVCLARERVLDRPVAIKVLRRGLNDEAERERFRTEGRLAASLNHPNIVDVFDYGVTAGLCYLVYQYVQGQTLEGRLLDGDGPLDPLFVVDLAVAVLSALDEAHGRGIVHRDIKPENVLLAEEQFESSSSDLDLLGWIRVTDFGIAKILGGDEPVRTRTGIILGTPAYMAPEQCSDEAVDGRADLYALACVLYRCIAGCLPVDGPPLEVITAHLKGSFPPLSLVAPDAHRELVAIVMRAMARRPRDRWASAREMLAACRAFRSRLLSGQDEAMGPSLRPTRAMVAPAGVSQAGSRNVLPGPRGRTLARNLMRRSYLPFLGGALLAGLLLWGLLAGPGKQEERLNPHMSVVEGRSLRLAWTSPRAYRGSLSWLGSKDRIEELQPRQRHVLEIPLPEGALPKLTVGVGEDGVLLHPRLPARGELPIGLGPKGRIGWKLPPGPGSRMARSPDGLDFGGGAPLGSDSFVEMPPSWADRPCWIALPLSPVAMGRGDGDSRSGSVVEEERRRFVEVLGELLAETSRRQGWTACAHRVLLCDLATAGGELGAVVDWETSDAGEAWRVLHAALPWLKTFFASRRSPLDKLLLHSRLQDFLLTVAVERSRSRGRSAGSDRFLELGREIEGLLGPFVAARARSLSQGEEAEQGGRQLSLLSPGLWKDSLWFASNSRWVRGNGSRESYPGGPVRWVGIRPLRAVSVWGGDGAGWRAYIWGNRLSRKILTRAFRRRLEEEALLEPIERLQLAAPLVEELLHQGYMGAGEGAKAPRPWLVHALRRQLEAPERLGLDGELLDCARRRIDPSRLHSRSAHQQAMERALIEELAARGLGAERLQPLLASLLREMDRAFLTYVNASPDEPELSIAMPHGLEGARGELSLELDVAGLSSSKRIVVEWEGEHPFRFTFPAVEAKVHESFVVSTMMALPPGEPEYDLDDPRPPCEKDLTRLELRFPAACLPEIGTRIRLHLLSMSLSDVVDCVFLRGLRIVEKGRGD